MKKQDKIYLLDQMLKAAKYPISMDTISERLKCSVATVYRTISDLRDGYGAPIKSDNENSGFYYADNDSFELPGLRLQADEVEALLMASHLLEDIQSGLLKEPLSRLLDNISNLLKEHGIKDKRNIQIIYALFRKADSTIFSQVFSALQDSKRIEITYQARSTNESSVRIVSPLKLTNYKNAWYLDSWCHLREGIRSFALEQIVDCSITSEDCRTVDKTMMKEHFSGSYGIFSGEHKYTARMKVSAKVASWVIKEQWHSKQKINPLQDGSLFLEVPYNNDIELVMDIMRYGDNIIVLSPESLRHRIKHVVSQMLENYSA